MIELTNVSYAYKKNQVIRDINVVFEKNKIYGITGRNGAGKTTLVKLISGILQPTGGNILIDEKNTKDMSTTEVSKVAYYCFQNPEYQLFCETVFDEVAFSLRYNKLEESVIKVKVQKILNVFGLEGLVEHYPLKLSGGEKQRLAMATGLVQQPGMLILDEPTSSLDQDNIQRLIHIIKTLNKTENMGFIVISHNESFIKAITDTIYSLDKGKLYEKD